MDGLKVANYVVRHVAQKRANAIKRERGVMGFSASDFNQEAGNHLSRLGYTFHDAEDRLPAGITLPVVEGEGSYWIQRVKGDLPRVSSDIFPDEYGAQLDAFIDAASVTAQQKAAATLGVFLDTHLTDLGFQFHQGGKGDGENRGLWWFSHARPNGRGDPIVGESHKTKFEAQQEALRHATERFNEIID